MHPPVRLAAALTVWATVGCSSGEETEPAKDASVSDTHSPADSSREDSRVDSTIDTSTVDSVEPEDTTVTAADAHDDGDARETCVEPDSWLVAPWDTSMDETGCTKIWRRRVAVGTGPYAFGPKGLTLNEDNHIEQGPLVGDFDLTLEVLDIIPPRPGASYGPYFYMSAPSCGHSYGTQIYLYPRGPIVSVFDASALRDEDRFSTDTHDYRVHIVRTGRVFTVTVDAPDGKSATATSRDFTTVPLHWYVESGKNAPMTLRKLTILGGGTEARSDDFTCDSIF